MDKLEIKNYTIKSEKINKALNKLDVNYFICY